MESARQSLLEPCYARLRALEETVDLGQSATVQELCMAIAAQRQRPIQLLSHPLVPPLTGVFFATATTDYIFYADDIPPALQQHTILHEVAHLLSLPPDEPGIDVDVLRRDLFPHLDPETIRAAFQRTGYHTPQEREAELLASLIEQRWLARRQQRLGCNTAGHAGPDIRWLHDQLAPLQG
jgi:hypothetical protein